MDDCDVWVGRVVEWIEVWNRSGWMNGQMGGVREREMDG